MPTFDDAFDEVCAALKHQFGPAIAEFAGLEPFEAMVAVVLDRALGGGRWRAGLDGLADHGLLTPERLANGDILEIADSLREKGLVTASRTVRPLKQLARWVVAQRTPLPIRAHDADTGEPPIPVAWLRNELGRLKGIGPAAADAIILFALKQPSYPVDRASFRVLVRHGWIDSTAAYDEARDLLVDRAERADDPPERQPLASLEDLSHGMERLGRQFCRAAAARCSGCPLERLLPEGGPREVDA